MSAAAPPTGGVHERIRSHQAGARNCHVRERRVDADETAHICIAVGGEHVYMEVFMFVKVVDSAMGSGRFVLDVFVCLKATTAFDAHQSVR